MLKDSWFIDGWPEVPVLIPELFTNNLMIFFWETDGFLSGFS